MKEFLQILEERGLLQKVTAPLSTELDISSVLFALQDKALLFEHAKESSLRLAGNLYGTRELLEIGLGLKDTSLAGFVKDALDRPATADGHISSFDKSAWDYNLEADLTKLPILKHFDNEAGKYMTAGIVAAEFPDDGENLSFHRMLVLSKNKVSARIVPRHLNQIAKDVKGKRVPVSVMIGPPPAVFLAASLQTGFGLSEYKIANKMARGKLELRLSELSDIRVPVDSEIVLEGYLDYGEEVKEGPFVDLTGTYDEVRTQPVITLQRMHYRKDSVYQAVVASTSEHALFMGFPQELKIRDALSKSIPKVRGINLTPASGGYFHCVVSIEKANDGDGKTAILNCFAASHPLKLVVAVDGDIDPFDPSQVEWALTTRFQADRGVVIVNGAKGSSLDPSSGKLAVTSKLGLDATLSVRDGRSKFAHATISSSQSAKRIIGSLRIAPKRRVVHHSKGSKDQMW